MTQAIIFGDIGGHATPLKGTLKSLGVDISEGKIPENLHFIQVGDLVHKGPDSDEVVSIVNKLMPTGRWTQLLGNHELMHFYPPKFYHCNCSPETVETMRSWIHDDKVDIAASFKVKPHKYLSTGTILITHAGITSLFYKQYGDANITQFVTHLNENKLSDFVNRSGIMLSGPRFAPIPDWKVGPIWAHSVQETYASWTEIPMPFDQIHGHTSPFDFSQHQWWANVSKHWRKQINVYQDNTAFTVLNRESSVDGNFISVDPGFERTAHLPALPYFEVELDTLT